MPLKSIVKSNLNEINYGLKDMKNFNESPYEMNDEVKNKYFIPGKNIFSLFNIFVNYLFFEGYTGFVPFMHDMGKRYSTHTNDSLIKFKKVYEKKINLNHEVTNINDGNCLFPINSSMVPHYSGHIPGLIIYRP
jgi:hypothetical protein